jgi:hypothetical protein
MDNLLVGDKLRQQLKNRKNLASKAVLKNRFSSFLKTKYLSW